MARVAIFMNPSMALDRICSITCPENVGGRRLLLSLDSESSSSDDEICSSSTPDSSDSTAA